MEPKFQTSFIPKKPMAGTSPSAPLIRRPKSAGTNVFMAIAIVVFVVALAGAAGAFMWKQYLISAQTQYKKDLTEREKQFSMDQLEQLKKVNVQIESAHQILRQHLAISQIFGIIGKFTIQNVRFLTMDLTTPGLAVAGVQSDQSGVKLTMSGYGANLSSVAFQSDVLSALEDYGLHDIVKNPALANPQNDTTGTVSFNFTGMIEPRALSYEALITGTTTPY